MSLKKIAMSRFLAFSLITSLFACSILSLRSDQSPRIDKLTYHYNPQRTGWNDRETVLTPQSVASPALGLVWQSLPLDYFNGTPPRLFAVPLYADEVQIAAGPYAGRTFPALYVVTTTGFSYALSAAEAGGTLPGSVLWRKQLTSKPCYEGTMGNLATPVIHLKEHTLYVASCDDDAHWQVHALDIRSGDELPGWPINIDQAALNAPGVNKNGIRRWDKKKPHTQRGALNLSPDGSRLYIAFGPDPGGWIVAVDTVKARVASAFSSTAVDQEEQGGMWASGGPSVDKQGRVHIATGANFGYTMQGTGIAGVFPNSAGHWGQSILQLEDDPVSGFKLKGTYAPFNYCQAAANDIDLGSSGTVLIDLDPRTTSTPRLLTLGGGKQGNVYLLDRDHMPGGVIKRQPCSTDSESDSSLLAPDIQSQFGKRGPINVFGPYTEEHALLDQARSRSTLAYFRAASGESYLFVTGSSKTGPNFMESVPPGLAKLKIVTADKQPAYLKIDRLEQTQTFMNPGSPVVTSNGGKDAIVWVLDTNAKRTAPLYGASAPQPVLYAFDALSLGLLWKSPPGALQTSGKYNEPTIVNGVVFVGTDRIQAFGLNPRKSTVATAVENQFKPLFDGKTLKQWRGDPALWSVRDGAITGESTKPLQQNSFLIHEGRFRNFELRLKYRLLTPNANSGVQYRSRPFPENEFSVAGYQANVVPPAAKERYAMLYDEKAREILALLGEKTNVAVRNGKVGRRVLSLINQPESVHAVDRLYPEWNDYVIIAYDNRLVQAINGMLAVDVADNDFEGRATEGFFALQVHAGPAMGVQFKDIEVKALTAPPDIATRFSSRPAPAPVPQLMDSALREAIKTGEQIYAARCTGCHGTSQTGAPPKETLAQLPRQKIADTLVNGTMQSMALGLSDVEINSIASYLTSVPAPAPENMETRP